MRLAHLLWLAISTLLVVVFVLIYASNTWTMRQHLQQQLSLHAQDTATFIGIAIANGTAADFDLSRAETLINAVFDRGYYEQIVLTGLNGETLLQRRNSGHSAQVPEWFSALFTLAPPVGKSRLSHNWREFGGIEVSSHPGIAYQSLWRSMQLGLLMLLALLLISGGLAWLFIDMLTKPLLMLENRAKDITYHQIGSALPIPKTLELKRITEVFNQMSATLADWISELAQQSDNYKKKAFEDPVTGLPNRQAFDLAIETALSVTQEPGNRVLLAVCVTNLAELNQRFGWHYVDNMLAILVAAIKQAVAEDNIPQMSMFRISGSEFAMTVDNEVFRAEWLSALKTRLEKAADLEADKLICVGVPVLKNTPQGQLMARLDAAQSKAMASPQRVYMEWSKATQHSRFDWATLLQDLLKSGELRFVGQSIKSIGAAASYTEWFAQIRLPATAQTFTASDLFAHIYRHGLAGKFDRWLVSAALKRMQTTTQVVSINISEQAMCEPAYRQWLIAQLSNNKNILQRLVIEVNATLLNNPGADLLACLKHIQHLGVRVAIQQYGWQSPQLIRVQDWKADIVKIDRRFVRGIQEQDINYQYVQLLCSYAQKLSILVVAEGIETRQEVDCISQLPVDYLQGYFFGEPKALS